MMYIRHPDDMGDLPSNKQNIQDIHSVSYGILVVSKSKLYAVSLALPVAQFNVGDLKNINNTFRKGQLKSAFQVRAQGFSERASV